MCGGGGGGGGDGGALGQGAAIASGAAMGVSSGQADPASAVGSAHGGVGTGSQGASSGVSGGGWDTSGTQTAVSLGMMSPEMAASLGKGFMGAVASGIPMVGTALSALGHLGAIDFGSTEGSNVSAGSASGASSDGTGPGGIGGPGETPVGPQMSPEFAALGQPQTPAPPVAPTQPTPQAVPTTMPATMRPSNEAMLEAVRRDRLARENKFAQQRAEEEAARVRALSLRDVAHTNTPESRLTKPPTASRAFLGERPRLGQSRHLWG